MSPHCCYLLVLLGALGLREQSSGPRGCVISAIDFLRTITDMRGSHHLRGMVLAARGQTPDRRILVSQIAATWQGS